MEGENRRRVETVLLGHPAVGDCAVVDRMTPRGGTRTVAYVVKTAPVAHEELRRWLADEMPSAVVPDVVVAVSAIPLTPEGDVDEATLATFETADAALAERWHAALSASPGVTRLVAVVQETRPATLPLHLADLLPSHVHRRVSRPAAAVAAASGSCGAASNAPAVCDGGPLDIEADEPTLLGDTLLRAVRSNPAQGLLYVEADQSHTFQTYASLLEEARRVLAGLRRTGLEPGAPVVLQLPRHRQFLSAFWGCVLGGFVPVPLAVATSYDRPASSLQSLASVWDTLGRPPVIVERRARRDFSDAASRLSLDGIGVHAVEDLWGDPDIRTHAGNPDDLALLMLTSGSTGTPKAVMLSHRNLLSRSAGSRRLNGFSSADVTMNWMPLDHVAGLIYFHLRDVYLGCRQIHVPTEVVLQDPIRWLELLERHRVSVTFAPNFAFGLVNDQEERLLARRLDLSSVRSILNGAEAIVARTARRFMRLLGPHGLPASAMQPAWGMSETSSGVTYNDRFSVATTTDDDQFVEVGRPIPGISMRIVDAADRIVGEGSVGRLQVRGATVTSGYFGSPETTRAAFTPDGWFNTGDLGTIAHGRLTITGREKDVVIVNSVNYYCHAIESAVEALEEVEPSYTAACAVRRADGNTDSLAIFFHPRSGVDDETGATLRRIRAQVAERIGVAPEYVLPVDRDAIPKTSLGKIQRSELARRLMAGEFDAAVRQAERMAAGPNTIPDWFYRKVWRPGRALNDRGAPVGAVVLLFADLEGVAVELRRRLESAGTRCVMVERAAAFAESAVGAYRLDPVREEHYAALVERLRSCGLLPSHVVHLWGYGGYSDTGVGGGVPAEELGALSAMRLAKALAELDRPQSLRMLFVGSAVQRVWPGDLVACEKTTVLGLVKSIPQELPWLQCRHLDIFGDDVARIAGSVAEELFAPRSEREVAYREGRRYVAGLEKVTFPDGGAGEPAIEREGFYVITGGAGGIGALAAAELRDRFGAKLLLVGRSALEGDRRAAVGALLRPGHVAYEQADVCDADRMNELVRLYEDRWNRPLRGVLHLAGAYREGLVKDESADSIVAVLRPKTVGTRVAYDLLARRGGGLLVCASSLAGFFGGATIAAYSAASAFQDAFADAHDGRSGVRCRTMSWSNWDGVGQSRSLQIRDLPRSRGYRPMDPNQAIQSLLVAAAWRDPAVIVGLDGDHPHIRRYRVDEASTTERVRLYFTGARGAIKPSQIRAVELGDAFGVPSTPVVARVAEMPLTASGAVSVDELMRVGDSTDGSPRPGPATGDERELADIWKRVLAVPYVSAGDNFFDLGGDSLLAARLLGDIHERFGVEVSLRDVFDAATLTDLARTVRHRAASTDAASATSVDGREPIEHLLARIDEIADDEVDRLLKQYANEGAEGE